MLLLYLLFTNPPYDRLLFFWNDKIKPPNKNNKMSEIVPRYINGIPVRTVAEGDQQDDFIEETEDRG